MEQYHIFVSGTVQGVGFRYFTLYTAKNYDIRGWVRNLPNGNVEIVAQGSEKVLRLFLKEIRKGPRYGIVKHLEISRESVEDFKTFTIN